jgi:hypothetical protein
MSAATRMNQITHEYKWSTLIKIQHICATQNACSLPTIKKLILNKKNKTDYNEANKKHNFREFCGQKAIK